jgi:hypothetical protein
MKLTLRDARVIVLVWIVWLIGEVALERGHFDDRASFAWFVVVSLFSFAYGRHVQRHLKRQS